MSYKKIFTNTIFLYGKSILTVFITMYSTRLILKAMGVEDYGIYSLIGGVISMLIFLNLAMSSATQRYISIFLGKGQYNKLNSIFHTTVLFHLIIAICLVIILEIIGLFLFDGFLNIPIDRIESAKVIFQFVIVSTFFSINAAPYDALIKAHEDMKFLAIVGVFETLVTLGIAIFITYSSQDKLLTFGFLNMLLIILSRIIRSVFCKLNYNESKLSFNKFKEHFMFKEMFAFARWNLLGTISFLARSQGVGVVLNLFLGTVANTAYGISRQLSNQVNFFSQTIFNTFRPQIVKNEGAGKRTEMISMSLVLCKFSYLLLAFAAIPVLFEMYQVLLFWLGEVPRFTVIICTGLILSLLTNQITIGLDAAIHAIGDIRKYMLVGGLLKFLLIPIAYVILYFELTIIYIMFSYLLVDIIVGLIRYKIFKGLIKFEKVNFVKTVIIPVAIPTIITVVWMVLFKMKIDFEYRFFYTVISGAIIFVISSFLFSFSKNERKLGVSKIKSLLLKQKK
ncbi:MATE family efflux transporter [uncultured Winogradskyella sp.]|uniref:lipopolysaccharide biosynthesis protein n=1 Tax=uncultured Winogradskyella sp. TaxID=395353 RepID=UPI002639BD5B|nr:MATE family efflux transporter [uncultured Winogradskyella sp.]